MKQGLKIMQSILSSLAFFIYCSLTEILFVKILWSDLSLFDDYSYDKTTAIEHIILFASVIVSTIFVVLLLKRSNGTDFVIATIIFWVLYIMLFRWYHDSEFYYMTVRFRILGSEDYSSVEATLVDVLFCGHYVAGFIGTIIAWRMSKRKSKV